MSELERLKNIEREARELMFGGGGACSPLIAALDANAVGRIIGPAATRRRSGCRAFRQAGGWVIENNGGGVFADTWDGAVKLARAVGIIE